MNSQENIPADSPSQSQPTRVLVVDDNRDLTKALGMLFEAEKGIEWVGSLHCADSMIEETRRLQADVVVMDAFMVGKDPFTELAEMAQQLPHSRAIVFSASDDPEIWARATNAGAHGCVCKFADPDTIIRAVREV